MTTYAAKERSAAFELSWSLTVEGAVLELAYAISAAEEMFVADRVWDYDSQYQRIPDPFGVYRFVCDGSLRLVFAQAPWPPNIVPLLVYHPLYSRVRAGETHRRSLRIALPVDEYSSMARDVDSPVALEEVSRATLVMGYVLRSSLDADPEPPINETVEEAGYVTNYTDLAISSMDVVALPVKRRTGYIARFALPGEPPPGPFVPPKT
jgi:hypothetical protein